MRTYGTPRRPGRRATVATGAPALGDAVMPSMSARTVRVGATLGNHTRTTVARPYGPPRADSDDFTVGRVRRLWAGSRISATMRLMVAVARYAQEAGIKSISDRATECAKKSVIGAECDNLTIIGNSPKSGRKSIIGDKASPSNKPARKAEPR